MVSFLWTGKSGKHQILFSSSDSPSGLVELVNLAPTDVHRKLLLTHVFAAWIGTVLTAALQCLKRGTGHCYLSISGQTLS